LLVNLQENEEASVEARLVQWIQDRGGQVRWLLLL
jgi:hypothetical protein